MPISVVCQACGSRMKVPSGAAGKRVGCPKCEFRLLVPEAAEVEAPTLPPTRPRGAAPARAERPASSETPRERAAATVTIGPPGELRGRDGRTRPNGGPNNYTAVVLVCAVAALGCGALVLAGVQHQADPIKTATRPTQGYYLAAGGLAGVAGCAALAWWALRLNAAAGRRPFPSLRPPALPAPKTATVQSAPPGRSAAAGVGEFVGGLGVLFLLSCIAVGSCHLLSRDGPGRGDGPAAAVRRGEAGYLVMGENDAAWVAVDETALKELNAYSGRKNEDAIR